MQLYVLFKLAFTTASDLKSLTSLHTLTRRTVLQKVPHRALGALCACKHKVSGSFHSPPGVLFTFPSQYFSTIGHQVVFRLGGWSPRVLTGFHVPADTLDTDYVTPCFTYRTLTFFGWLSHAILLHFVNHVYRSEPRRYFYPRFSLLRFRSPLLAESRLISFPLPT